MLSVIKLLALWPLLLLLASAQSPPGPRRLLRCPAELSTLVEPLPDNPDVQPVLTTGPGVRLQTVRFMWASKLRLDSAGRLWLIGGNFSRSAGNRFSGPHVLLCSDTERRGLATFSLFVRLAPDITEVNTPDSLPEATATSAAPSAATKTSAVPSTAVKASAAPERLAAAPASAANRAVSRIDDPLFCALAAAVLLLLAICIALAFALLAVGRRSHRRTTQRGLKGPIFKPIVKGSAEPLFQQSKPTSHEVVILERDQV
ncbi:hypothetical protein BOX15_Mlig008551g2 [Macrostomum lignano]|uniref:Uncharacterized protein n=1 Tax=Macrostomum lignano TaxID=282301 RepID=A0A267GJG8_9PLAT|nr:hypothetical protein BOX15_Mlig008551g1 [Macrostomum lignano]PAA85389.1 hypothetical protein BOX15_Mlig008551g2 [Macrostomum lignano]